MAGAVEITPGCWEGLSDLWKPFLWLHRLGPEGTHANGVSQSGPKGSIIQEPGLFSIPLASLWMCARVILQHQAHLFTSPSIQCIWTRATWIIHQTRTEGQVMCEALWELQSCQPLCKPCEICFCFLNQNHTKSPVTVPWFVYQVAILWYFEIYHGKVRFHIRIYHGTLRNFKEWHGNVQKTWNYHEVFTWCYTTVLH